VINFAYSNDTTTHAAALQIALNRIKDIGKVKLGY
jgi:hypothetical protein